MKKLVKPVENANYQDNLVEALCELDGCPNLRFCIGNLSEDDQTEDDILF